MDVRTAGTRFDADSALGMCALVEVAFFALAAAAFGSIGLGQPLVAAAAWLALSLWQLHRVRRGGRIARGFLVVEAGVGLAVFALGFAADPSGYLLTVGALSALQLGLLLHPAVREHVQA